VALRRASLRSATGNLLAMDVGLLAVTLLLVTAEVATRLINHGTRDLPRTWLAPDTALLFRLNPAEPRFLDSFRGPVPVRRDGSPPC